MLKIVFCYLVKFTWSLERVSKTKEANLEYKMDSTSVVKIVVEEMEKDALIHALKDIKEKQGLKFTIVPNEARSDESMSNPGNNGENNSVQSVVPVVQGDQSVEEKLHEGSLLNAKELALKITKWLDAKGIARASFAKEYLNRSKSTFSDMLKYAPSAVELKGVARESWLKISKFLSDTESQKKFVNSVSKGKMCKKRAASKCGEASRRKAKQQKRNFTQVQKVTLDQMYQQTAGKPEKESIGNLAHTLNLDTRQVRNFSGISQGFSLQ